VVTLARGGGARVEESWPAILPAASGAGYSPRARLVPGGAAPPSRAVLEDRR
jgi:hypothetical protein